MLKSRSMPAVWIVLIWFLVMIFPGGCAKKATLKEEAMVTQEQKAVAQVAEEAAVVDAHATRERALREQALRDQAAREAAERATREAAPREQALRDDAAAREAVERATREAASREQAGRGRTPVGVVASAQPAVVISKHVSPEFGADAALLARREAYRKELKQASYTFNPPSPIKVAKPVTVHFWLDPLAEPMRLAEELKAELLKMRPGETPKTKAGRMDWSPKMRAKLTGDDFVIIPTEGKDFDGLKTLSATRRTEWSWDVKAKNVGPQLPLHLKVWAVLPQELGDPDEVLKLDELIHVEVTFLWLVDEFWEKYWKGILGGLGTALAGAITAWWNIRRRKAAGG
ncbi:MAG: hypothetical protein NT047_03555 [Deltaproteobacteria bacterium]|nr:hypothetical protein [Deltaproteobacteria bacterium]